MTSLDVPRNMAQKIPTIAINVRKVKSGGTDGDFYTCPIGKKAIIKGTAVCTGFGAGSTANLQFAGEIFHTWDMGLITDPWQRITVRDIVISFNIQLNASEVVRYTQNSGTNAEMNMNATVQESPI